MTQPSTPPPPLLRVERLRVEFPMRAGGRFAAVDDVSFDLARGETLGVVGESGSGKTTLGRATLRLVPAAGGRVTFDGVDVLGARGEALRRLRRRMQIVFQDPGGALDPRMRVEDIVTEPIAVHEPRTSRADRRARAQALLDRCGMPRSAMRRLPHEFSGGQRQRIGIARALTLRPDLIVCDEPTSALDVSVQAQILNLLRELQSEFGLSYLFISHDMGVVRHMCDRVLVMLRGKVVEQGACAGLIGEPRHEYTRELIGAAAAASVPADPASLLSGR